MLMAEPAQPPRKATPLQVAKAVASAFVGIRKRAAHEEEAVAITPLQVVVAGVLGAALLVFALIVIVRLVTG